MARYPDKLTVADAAPPSAYLTVTKVVREHVPLHIRPGYGETLGQMIDAHIAACIDKGDEISSVTLEFSPEQFNALAGAR